MCIRDRLYTVFAKIDGEKFSAFLVERDTPGLTVGAEEHKLGIRGSSTCPLVLQGCKVPAGNLLGEPGKGHHIAFNVLNVGRFKLGVACVGGARHALAHTILSLIHILCSCSPSVRTMYGSHKNLILRIWISSQGMQSCG